MKMRWHVFRTALCLVAAALLLTACPGDLTEDDFGFLGPLPLGVEFRIHSWYTGYHNHPHTFLRAEVTEYSEYGSLLPAPGLGELRIGPRITDGSDYDVWILVRAPVAEGQRDDVMLIRNVALGMYLSMHGAGLAQYGAVHSPGNDWSWNRPLIRPLVPGNDLFHWRLIGGNDEAFIINSVGNTGRDVTMQTSNALGPGPDNAWAEGSVQARENMRLYGTTHWLFVEAD